MKRLDSPCMFCGELPCVCNKPAKKISKAKPSPKTNPQPKVETAKAVVFTSNTGGRDLSYLSALESLVDIVHADDRKKLQLEILKHTSPDMSQSIDEWKSRYDG